METREDLKYSKEHEWIQIEGDIATIGVTDFAQDSLGDVVYVGLPEVGTIVEEGESMGTIESVKAVSDLYTPIHGEVIEINNELEDAPETVNGSPYDEGWMVKLKIDSGDNAITENLMDAEAYKKHTEEG